MRRALSTALVAAAAAVAASPAAATNECRGLQVCIPVAGPWVVATAEQTEFQLSCPRRFIVAGLDAELSRRGIDVGFVGALGSPVNPGITTSRDAVFLGRNLRRGAATFRPHIGCVPASGGGRRTPTAYHAFPPSKPTARRVVNVRLRGGSAVRRATCARREVLVNATYAIGFRTAAPPAAETIAGVRASQRIKNGVVTLTVHAPPGARAVAQLDLLCAPR